MTVSDLILRIWQLGPVRRRLILRAALLLTGASAAVAILPFRHAIRLGAVRLGTKSEPLVSEWLWAVEKAARVLPWRTMCIEQALATQRFLRIHGADAVLHYGARHRADRSLEAHVWVTVGDAIVIGGAEADGFAELAAYP